MHDLIEPGSAVTADLPGLLRAAHQERIPIVLTEAGGTLHTTIWCDARTREGESREVSVTLEAVRGYRRLEEHSLCRRCSTSSRPGLKSLAREGGCRIALQRLHQIGLDGPLEETAPIWEVLDEHSSGAQPGTRQEAALATRALEAEWSSWTPEKVGGGEKELWAVVPSESVGPGIALTAGCSQAELGEYRLLAVPERYHQMVSLYTHSSLGGPARPDDSRAVYETALTLWDDANDDDLPGALERARLVHLQ